MLKATPNQLLVPKGETAASDYDSFRLKDSALDFVLSPIPGQRLMLSRTAS
jgi:type IV secretion system protein VirB4